MKIIEKLGCRVDFASAPHERGLDKPNEDKIVIDEEKGIFIVLDGVTRVHAEYEEHPFESAALKVGEIFMEQAYDYIKNHINDPDPKKILEGAVKVANEKIREYRSQRGLDQWVFYPSTLGILSILRNSTLHYICVGDCIAALLRGSSKILFGRQFSLEAVDLHKVSKSERYDIYCNHPENHLSYTVFNGDDEVNVGIEYSFIDLHEGDTLLLASDGIGNYIKYEKNVDLVTKTADEMISLSKKYDLQPYADYADDKSIIKLSF